MTTPFLDAAQTLIFARQLEEIDLQLYDVKYAKLEALELVSAKPLNPGAETYTYSQFDSRGIAKVTANYANGSPRAEASGLQFTATVKSLRESYGYNVQEIRASQMSNVPLEALRAMAARRAINEGLNDLALLGNTEFNLPGLFKLASTNTVTIAADGTGSSKLWSTKAGDLIIRDMLAVVDKIPNVTKEVENAKRLLMPYSCLRQISAQLMPAANGVLLPVTVLKHFQTIRPSVEVRGALKLDTAGASSDGRLMAYDPDRINVEWLLPIPFESFSPQLQGMEWVIECHARAGGVVCRYPLTICYGDGVL